MFERRDPKIKKIIKFFFTKNTKHATYQIFTTHKNENANKIFKPNIYKKHKIQEKIFTQTLDKIFTQIQDNIFTQTSDKIFTQTQDNIFTQTPPT
jgi:hypothetical protein